MNNIISAYLIFLLAVISTFSLNGQDFEVDSYMDGGLSTFEEVDFNEDGKPDLIGYHYKAVEPIDLEVLINVSDTTIKFDVVRIASSELFRGSPAIGDLDGDGDFDIAVSLDLSNSIMILRNNGDNTFTQEEPGLSGANQLKFLDLEGDGDMDLIGFVYNTNAVSTFVNDGSGTLSAGPIMQHVNDISSVDYGDIDNDGDQDIALAIDKFSGETVAIYLNDSLNNFTKLSSFDINALNSAVQVKMIDINKDGKMDVLGLNDKRLTAFIQNDVFGFVSRDLVDPNNEGDLSQFEIADFDGNGTLDVVIGDYTENMRWYKNQGLVFTQHEVSGMRPIYELISADFDQDGDVDFIASNGDFRAFRNEIEQMPSSISTHHIVELSIHPNPVQDFLNLHWDEIGNSKVVIYSNTGSKVLEKEIKNGANKINVTSLEKGFYLLSLHNNQDQVLTQKKFIKI
ncbi:FG-GAP-like repeat-containing protein [Portibacter lacus]|uniref:Secretion system C-terminal sorting domain-containing protein n=1 Tax=Portibacter lacus TaxID=1099794 RepID=A0AA37STE9_9BACT|nr:FG-GAP-like repeat-containing protein [Portibacter lacus]GLR18486.1 hypothetical protein GCM10007940_31020 [Portibacter lacus]